MRRVVFAIGSRANWASCKAVVRRALREDCQVRVIAYASAVLSRYGDVAREISEVCQVTRIGTHVEGGGLLDAVQSGAHAVSLVGAELAALRPDVVYVVGDRYEVLPVAYAAQLLNLRVAHQMGGEVTGTVDEPIRHAITKLSHMHLVATEQAEARVRAMGETDVYRTGCPRLDLCQRLEDRPGEHVIVVYHPVTTEHMDAGEQMTAVLDGVAAAFSGPVHLWWPNADAGTERIVDAVRDRHTAYLTHRTLPAEHYLALLASARCIVGNSSSAIREGGYLGTPAVDIGTRQRYRERGANVMHVETSEGAVGVVEALSSQLRAQRYPRSTLYGDGTAAEQIVGRLLGELPAQQKHWRT